MVDTVAADPRRKRQLGLLATSALLATSLLAVLVLAEDRSVERASGVIPAAAALAAFMLSLLAALKGRRCQGRPWFLSASGCLGWTAWHFGEAGSSIWSNLLLNVSYLCFVASFATGALMVLRFAPDRTGRVTVMLNTLPQAIALCVGVWVISAGSFALDSDIPGALRASGVVHGVGSVTLLVVGVAGALSDRRHRFEPANRVLLTAVTLLGLADAFWLQGLTGSVERATVATNVVFGAAFGCASVAALVSLNRRRDLTGAAGSRRGNGRIGWESQLPDVALAALLLLAGEQAVFGETVPYAVATILAGALAMLVFIVTRQSIVLRRDRHLRREIGQLSEQIDGLISQVGRDPLTGLVNHRAAHERIDQALAAGRTSGHPVAVALIDVDNFKSINDSLGHQAGDRVLRAVASILTAACRGTDAAARYAGDEFMVLLPGLDELHAGSVCARIAQEVRRVNHDLRLGDGVRVSLSIGVAVTHACQRSVAQTVAIADAAMYDAKEGGKDRVVVVNADTLVISNVTASARLADQLMAESYALAVWGDQDRRAV